MVPRLALMPPPVEIPPPADPMRPVVINRRFRNPGHHLDRTWLEALRWKLGSRAVPWPPITAQPPSPAPGAPAAGLAATWIGHASFLVQNRDAALLIDPVWSDRIGVLGRLGPRRHMPPGVAIESLPRIDAILLSHDHYDHCDLPTLRRLARDHPCARLLAPLGFADLARRAGFGPDRITLHDWWDTTKLALPNERVVLTATPARHWSNRLSGARNQRLWCGWHIATPGAALHFAGDTALDEPMFAAIRSRLGAPDLALLPIGAYAPRWFMHEQHCDPDEAVRLFLALGARRGVGMHWGTFRLTDEARDEPPARLAAAVRAAGLPAEAFVSLAPGGTVVAPATVHP